MNLFYKSLEFLKKNKKNIAYVGLFFLFMYLSTDLSFAEGENSFDKATVQFLTGIVGIAGALLGMLTFLVSLFLHPGWTSGSIIGLTDPLKTMWIMVSNIVYFVFAFIFIWIAFMNVIGKEGDHYQLKQAIPRFIVGVIMVPFSWFLVQFVISLSSILSVVVLSLPYDTFQGSTFFSDENLSKITFCSSRVNNRTNSTGKKDSSGGNTSGSTTSSTGGLFPIECEQGSKKISLKEIVNPEKSESLYGIVAFYTYGVMSLDQNGKLFQADVMKGMTSVFQLTLKMMFDLLFIIIYFVLMLALTLVLFVRGVMLWLFAMFSPVFGLLYFFKKTGEGMGEGASKNFSIKELINLAFVPVYVAGALSFGMLFLFIAGSGFSKNVNSGNEYTNQSMINVNSGTIQMGLIKYTDKGAFGAANDPTKTNFITGFQGSFGTMLMELFGLGILWMALMAAVHHSKITASVAQPFEEFGNSIGGLIKKLPTYAPIIPTPGGGMMSSASLGTAGQSFKSSIDSHFSEKGSEVGRKMSPFGSTSSGEMAAINAKNQANQTKHDAETHIREMSTKISDLNKTLSSHSEKEQFLVMIKKHFGDNVANGLKDVKNSQLFATEFKSLLDKNKNDPNMPKSGKELYEGDLVRKDATGIISYFQGVSVASNVPPQANSITHTPVAGSPNNVNINFTSGGSTIPITVDKTLTGADKIAEQILSGDKIPAQAFTKSQFREMLKQIFGGDDSKIEEILTKLEKKKTNIFSSGT